MVRNQARVTLNTYFDLMEATSHRGGGNHGRGGAAGEGESQGQGHPKIEEWQHGQRVESCIVSHPGADPGGGGGGGEDPLHLVKFLMQIAHSVVGPPPLLTRICPRL